MGKILHIIVIKKNVTEMVQNTTKVELNATKMVQNKKKQ